MFPSFSSILVISHQYFYNSLEPGLDLVVLKELYSFVDELIHFWLYPSLSKLKQGWYFPLNYCNSADLMGGPFSYWWEILSHLDIWLQVKCRLHLWISLPGYRAWFFLYVCCLELITCSSNPLQHNSMHNSMHTSSLFYLPVCCVEKVWTLPLHEE